MENLNIIKKRVALLSNVNVSFIIRKCKKQLDMYAAEGYGNELGLLLNKQSGLYKFEPQVIILCMDIAELLGQQFDIAAGKEQIVQWFEAIESILEEGRTYFISDAFLHSSVAGSLFDKNVLKILERTWDDLLVELCNKHRQVIVFPYRDCVEKLGIEQAFNDKTWYMGKIPHSVSLQSILAEEIVHRVTLLSRIPKKVLVVDLDNTLWGGIAGEYDVHPIELSDDHAGLIYRNVQRMILQMKKQGTILAIASKNNEKDAMKIINEHPHMVLRKADFSAMRINWNQKDVSLREMAEELNLGLSSFVFWDDNPTERELISQMLPEVAVPEFPENVEDLPRAIAEVYRTYFEPLRLTEEDKQKTEQYAANAKRRAAEKGALDFSQYLKQLEIVVERVDAKAHLERIHQLLNKTNQFNLTTKRHEYSEIEAIANDAAKEIFAFKVSDKFGEYGLVSVAIIDKAEVPVVEEFVMSCRVMGKYIERYILNTIEESILAEGHEKLQGIFIPSEKNMPVQALYDEAGYKVISEQESARWYELDIVKRPVREFYVKKVSLANGNKE